MQQVTVDSELRSKLGNLSKHLELKDESGTVVAWVVPRFDESDTDASWSEAELEFGREQYRQGKYVVGLKAVYAELRRLGTPGVPEE